MLDAARAGSLGHRKVHLGCAGEPGGAGAAEAMRQAPASSLPLMAAEAGIEGNTGED